MKTFNELRREEAKRQRRAEAKAGLVTCVIVIGTIFLYLASI